MENKKVPAVIQLLSKFLPKRMKLALEESITYSLLPTQNFTETIGKMVFGFIVASVLLAIVVFLVLGNPFLAVAMFPIGFFVFYILARSILLFMADSVSRQIEKVLPDMLMLMAANLRAGMIPENSFLASIKPEFGKLNLLLSHAAIETQGGKDFKDALTEMAGRTTSRFFKDTMRIIGEGLRSGAELHLILENLSVNILQNETIRNDMRAQVRSYALFIFLAATIAAPLLYGVSSFLITILDNISNLSSSSAQAPSSAVGLFSSFSIPQISPELILIVSVSNVMITAVASAILNGILNSGNAREGMRYIPIFLLIGIVIFFGVRFGVSSFFASSSITTTQTV
ncbi:MAG: type II secretion system F family protein [Candidatus Parvarchaeota archaeon]|nr:type II secretion system F family protein [Candidatus Parvarchaeota archaeon]